VRTLHQRLILATHIHVEYDNIYVSRLECETYFSRTENHIFALKSSTSTQKGLGSAQKRVDRISGNKQLFLTPN